MLSPLDRPRHELGRLCRRLVAVVGVLEGFVKAVNTAELESFIGKKKWAWGCATGTTAPHGGFMRPLWPWCQFLVTCGLGDG